MSVTIVTSVDMFCDWPNILKINVEISVEINVEINVEISVEISVEINVEIKVEISVEISMEMFCHILQIRLLVPMVQWEWCTLNYLYNQNVQYNVIQIGQKRKSPNQRE